MANQKNLCLHEIFQPFSTIVEGKRIEPKDGKIFWHVVNFTDDMPKFELLLNWQKAFQIIEREMGGIQFHSTKNIEEADIKLFFQNEVYKCPLEFEESTIAYGIAPYGGKRQGEIWLNDDAFLFLSMFKPGGVNVLKVFVHEIFHTLNVGHSKVNKDIMFPYISDDDILIITEDTRAALWFIYGNLMRENFDVIGFLKILFPKKTHISRQLKITVSIIATQLGIAVKSKTKKQLLTEVFNKLSY